MGRGVGIALGVTLAAGFAFAMWQAIQQETTVRCEVCVQFEGRTECRTSTGSDSEAAQYGARMAACAVLAQGVTRGMQCDKAPPRSVRCEGGDDTGY